MYQRLLWVNTSHFMFSLSQFFNKKTSTKQFGRNHSNLVWRVLRKLDTSCDLFLQFKQTIFVKHIFDLFSQTAVHILMKFGSYMHLSIGSSSLIKSSLFDLFSPNYVYELFSCYVTSIFTMYYYTCHSVISYFDFFP